VSDVAGELRLVEEAFARPTLRLLRGTWAAVQVAVLRMAFDRDRRSLPTDQLHAHIETILAILGAEGVEVPRGTGRELSRKWMNNKWLVRLHDEGGKEVYELTSYALEALELVQSLSSDRPLLSESRLAAILDVVRRQAIEATPDAQARIDRLDIQIAELTAERDRLVAGGEPEPASEDRMMEGYANLVDLISQLPSDFKRVEESIRGHRDSLLAEFRSDTRPLGQIIEEYLSRHDDLRETPEGRAFEGALRLLRDDVMLTQLRRDLDVILAHPFTGALTDDEIRAFQGTVKMIRRSLDDVLDQRSRVTKTLRDHIVNHDAVKERELSSTLASLHGELVSWVHRSSARARMPVALLPDATGRFPHLRERFYDPGDHVAPEPISEVAEELGSGLTLEEILQQGGPLLVRLRTQLCDAATEGEVTSGAAFNRFPDDLRRPVEVLGVLHLLSRIAVLDDTEEREEVETIRPDGSRRAFKIPAVSLDAERATRLHELEVG
jgi:uncharacterized small protein (DUF1192 family)